MDVFLHFLIRDLKLRMVKYFLPGHTASNKRAQIQSSSSSSKTCALSTSPYRHFYHVRILPNIHGNCLTFLFKSPRVSSCGAWFGSLCSMCFPWSPACIFSYALRSSPFETGSGREGKSWTNRQSGKKCSPTPYAKPMKRCQVLMKSPVS